MGRFVRKATRVAIARRWDLRLISGADLVWESGSHVRCTRVLTLLVVVDLFAWALMFTLVGVYTGSEFYRNVAIWVAISGLGVISLAALSTWLGLAPRLFLRPDTREPTDANGATSGAHQQSDSAE